MKYERIKFLVIALKNAVEVYAWAPKPYHKFMAFKVELSFPITLHSEINLANYFPKKNSHMPFGLLNQSFADLPHRPVLVDLTVEEGQRLKVIYGSCAGFHAIDVDSGNNYDIYIPVHVSCKAFSLQYFGRSGIFGEALTLILHCKQIQSQVTPHAIVFLPNSDGMEMLLCYEDEGVYVNTYGRIIKDVVLQWGEMPTSVGTTQTQRTLKLCGYVRWSCTGHC